MKTMRRIENGVREGCLDCVRKHLSQAGVLQMEMGMGYPHHAMWVMGHLAEAEIEAKGFPKVQSAIRDERLRFMDDSLGYEPQITKLFAMVDAVSSRPIAFRKGQRHSKKAEKQFGMTVVANKVA